MDEPRLRMFAGPNGSGKSTLKDILEPEWLGVYINPDDMEKAIRVSGYIDFTDYRLSVVYDALKQFWQSSTLLQNHRLVDDINLMSFRKNKLYFNSVIANSYHASALSDFARRELLSAKISFSFETVMSNEDKVLFLKSAQTAGFKTYLYYVATEYVEINIERVQIRVANGGHPVPEDKIRKRYDGSLTLLIEAIEHSNRAFIFDNSGEKPEFIAEVTNGDTIEMKIDEMPHWFKMALWDKFDA
jgi:predicted ABC-type ATPase